LTFSISINEISEDKWASSLAVSLGRH